LFVAICNRSGRDDTVVEVVVIDGKQGMQERRHAVRTRSLLAGKNLLNGQR
jgi:hypothetical protein